MRSSHSFIAALSHCLSLSWLVAMPLFAHDIPASRQSMENLWVRDGGPGVERPDTSNINAAGRAVMEAYDQEQDAILGCSMDWGRLNTVSSFPFEVIIGEDQVTLLYEYNHAVRRVFLDQTEFPVDYPPSLVGYSIGRWEGDSLVVETRKLVSGWINMDGVAPYTSEAVMTERFMLGDSERQLIVERTVVDPEYYDGPVTWTSRYRPSDFPVYPYDCTVGSYLTTDD